MKQWFSGLGLKSKEEPIEDSSPEPEANASLALKVLYDQLRHQRKYHILDLGPALGANVDFFSQFSCKVYIEDFYRTLTSFDYLSEGELSYQAVFEYLLPYQKNTRFDIILGWEFGILFFWLFPHGGTLLTCESFLPIKRPGSQVDGFLQALVK